MTDELKAELQAEWNAGDYSHTGPRVEPASIELARSLGIKAGDRMLDVAAGDGNLSLAAASRGASVHALDFSSVMVANGRRRTEGRDVTWHAGDAEDLPFEDGSFDIAASVFGVMFAPDKRAAADELARVVRSGGCIAVSAWTPSGNIGTFIRTVRGPLKDMPAGTPDPLVWGTYDGIAELLGPHSAEIKSEQKWVTFRYESWDAYMTAIESNGSARMAKEKLPPKDYERGLAVIRELVEGLNQATDGSVVFGGEYLETIALKKP